MHQLVAGYFVLTSYVPWGSYYLSRSKPRSRKNWPILSEGSESVFDTSRAVVALLVLLWLESCDR
jgi:hypothetical protein